MRHYVQVMQRLAAMSSSTIANTAIEYREAMEETSNIEEGVLKQINQMVEAKVNCDSVQQIGHGEIVYVHREQATHINTDARAHTHGRTGARTHGRTHEKQHARTRTHACTHPLSQAISICASQSQAHNVSLPTRTTHFLLQSCTLNLLFGMAGIVYPPPRQIIHEGQLTFARIERLDIVGGVVDVMLKHKVEYTRSNFEEGFDTILTKPKFTHGGVVYPYQRLKYLLKDVPRTKVYKLYNVLQSLHGITHAARHSPGDSPSASKENQGGSADGCDGGGGGGDGGDGGGGGGSSGRKSPKPTERTRSYSSGSPVDTMKTSEQDGRRTSIAFMNAPPLQHADHRHQYTMHRSLSLSRANSFHDVLGNVGAADTDGGSAGGGGGSSTLFAQIDEGSIRIEQFLCLFDSAEETLPLFKAIATAILARASGDLQDVRFRVAGLKGVGRAWSKVLRKYHGVVQRLTDIVRMTFICRTLAAILRVLAAVFNDPALEVVRIKNRLMLEFDALVTGGYRDLLINVRVKETG